VLQINHKKGDTIKTGPGTRGPGTQEPEDRESKDKDS